MRPRRKLLTKEGYRLLKAELDRGVPLKRALQNLNLNCSIPTAKQLLSFHQTDLIPLSPEWLDQNGALLQECPQNWRFKGFFPFEGEWLCTQQ